MNSINKISALLSFPLYISNSHTEKFSCVLLIKAVGLLILFISLHHFLQEIFVNLDYYHSPASENHNHLIISLQNIFCGTWPIHIHQFRHTIYPWVCRLYKHSEMLIHSIYILHCVKEIITHCSFSTYEHNPYINCLKAALFFIVTISARGKMWKNKTFAALWTQAHLRPHHINFLFTLQANSHNTRDMWWYSVIIITFKRSLK